MRTQKAITAGLMLLPIAASLALSGCGGTTINGGSPVSTNPSDATIFGINTTAYNTLSATADETSSFADPSGNPIATGAQDSTANAIFQIADGIGTAGNSTIALGFAAGAETGNPGNQVVASAMAPGETVSFGAYIANGQNSTGGLNPIESASLTSSDPQWGSLGTIPLNFASTSTYSGPLADDDYVSGSFKSPFTTSGIHTVVASVTDSVKTTTTTFNTIVLNSADDIGAVVAQAVVAPTFSGNNTPTVVEASPYGALAYGGKGFAPAVATITNTVTTANPYLPNVNPALSAFGYAAVTVVPGMTDQNGVAVVFAHPGTQTVTFTGIDPVTGNACSGSATVTVAAGQVTGGTATAPLQVVMTDTGSSSSARPLIRKPRPMSLPL